MDLEARMRAFGTEELNNKEAGHEPAWKIENHSKWRLLGGEVGMAGRLGL